HDIKEERITVTRHKLIHDIEQINYLVKNGLIEENYLTAVEIYKHILQKTDPEKFLTVLDKQDTYLLKKYWTRNIYIHKVPDFDKPVLNPELDFEGLQETFFNNPVNYLYIDNFLKEET